MADDLVNTNAIEYYLKGRAIKRQREQAAAQLQYQYDRLAEQEELRKQNLSIADARQKEIERHNKQTEVLTQAQADLANANANIKKLEHQLSRRKGVENGWLEFIDPQADDPYDDSNLRETAKGAAVRQEAENKRTEMQIVGPQQAFQKGQEAGAVAESQYPWQQRLAATQSDLRQAEARAREKFLHGEGLLRDENRLKVARERARIARATKIDRTQEYAELADATIPFIMSGDITRQAIGQMPSEERMALRRRMNQLGIVEISDDTSNRLRELPAFAAYIRKSEQLQKMIKGKGIIDNYTRGEVKTLKSEIDALAKQFATNVQQDRSILGVNELPRLDRGTIQVNPEGFLKALSPISNKVNDEANERRLADMKEAYRQAIIGHLGSRSEAMYDSIFSKYGVDPKLFADPDLVEEEDKPKKPSAMR